MVIMTHSKSTEYFEHPYEKGCLGTISDVSLYWEIFFVLPLHRHVRFLFEIMS
jgi:hypothetical protein